MNSFADVRRLVTIEDRSSYFDLLSIGNAWSRTYYDGPFHLCKAPQHHPAISLVFVQSRDGNTASSDPADLGGGPTDKHLIYEGLSRVAADAVLAGASTVGPATFFTISHPELIALRRALGLPQHPAQIVMSKDGHIDLSWRLFNVPDVPVYILGGAGCVSKLASRLHDRPWITLLPIGDSLADAFARLRRDHGIGRLSAVGGRHAATALIDAGLVQDIYLTTSALRAGQLGTPWYIGSRRLQPRTIVSKREDAAPDPIIVEHLALGTSAGHQDSDGGKVL